MLPYFRKAEDQSRGADEWHGEGGPLCGLRSGQPADLRCVHRGGRAVRLPTQSGFQRRRARKASAITSSPRATGGAARPRSAISSPRGERANLKVVSNALATRVLFEGRRATGVEYLQGGATHTAHAARGDPRGRRVQFAAADAALRARPGRAAARARHRGRRRHAGRRRRPAGSFPRAAGLSLHAARFGQRLLHQQAARLAGRAGLRCCAGAACSRWARLTSAASCAPTRRSRRPTCRCHIMLFSGRRDRRRRCIPSPASPVR